MTAYDLIVALADKMQAAAAMGDWPRHRTARTALLTAVKAMADDVERLRAMADRMLGEHCAPADCYSTGPLKGDASDHTCPSCEYMAYRGAHQSDTSATGNGGEQQ